MHCITKYRLIALLAMQVVLFNLKAQCIITTIAGNGTMGYTGNGGYATQAELHYPVGIFIDSNAYIYIADAGNNCIRKINTTGIITTIAGNGIAGYSGDGGQATNAELSDTPGIAFDAAGNLYITDAYNNVIRKVNTQGIINTVVGNGTQGYSGDGGQAINAELWAPGQIAFDTLGNLFFSDIFNNIIRKVNTTGIISTVVGNGTAGYSGDGGIATSAELNQPGGIVFDKFNNLYIACGNAVRKVNISTGIISTIAGTGTQGYSGDGGQATAAELYAPDFITLDNLGNLYISDAGNSVIRKVNVSTGIITTIAGNGTQGYSGDGGPPLAAEFNGQAGLAFDTHNNLYVSDDSNQRIRKISNASSAGIEQYAVGSGQVGVYPNPANTSLTLTLSKGEGIAGVYMYDVLGNEVLSTQQKEIDVSNLPNGVYFVQVTTAQGINTQKVIVQH